MGIYYDEFKIEVAKADDINSIYQLILNRCLWFSKRNIIGWKLESYVSKYNKNYFKEQMINNKLYIAKIYNKICGVMLLKREDKEYWKDNKEAYYIHHLTTDINRKGIGKLLIDYAIKQCKKDNKEYLRLDCYKESAFLNDYYNKIGFVNVGNGKIQDYEYNLWEMKIINECIRCNK